MLQNAPKLQFRNRILQNLPPEDADAIQPFLNPLDLPLRTTLEASHRPIEFVYFLEDGIASVVAGAGANVAEVGVIGRDGMTGLALVLGADRSPQETYMQASGNGNQIAASDFVDVMKTHPTLQKHFLLFAHVFAAQASSTALCNARNKMEERLARWLLMAQDRLGTDALPLTHEFLAVMLGVQRPGVTIALNALEERELITLQRANIMIRDREGMIEASKGCYGVAEAEYKRVFGMPV